MLQEFVETQALQVKAIKARLAANHKEAKLASKERGDYRRREAAAKRAKDAQARKQKLEVRKNKKGALGTLAVAVEPRVSIFSEALPFADDVLRNHSG